MLLRERLPEHFGPLPLENRDFERSLQDLRLRPKGFSPIREKVGFTG